MRKLNVVLISTYELGHQPFGLASPAAWLEQAGAAVTCLDLAVQRLDEECVAAADLIALYVPMHTATRLATALVARLKRLNSAGHLCFYGLYAPANERYLRALGAQTILGGEFEHGLVALAARLTTARDDTWPIAPPDASPSEDRDALLTTQPDALPATHTEAAHDGQPYAAPIGQNEPLISLAKQRFVPPQRAGLPPLQRYAYLDGADGRRHVVGYTEASRGCKHLCRHCPIPPVYGGRFRVVQPEVVLEDIAWQVQMGARHVTFGDPDFFNGPGHALRIVGPLHHRFPHLTYDVTIKVEHLLQHAHHLPTLRDTGCLFVTSAVESVDDAILRLFDKRHTRCDVIRAVGLMREIGLTLNPTFVAFTPWTTRDGYLDLLMTILDLELVDHVAPIQYAIRLLIPAGSGLLDLTSVRELVGPFDEAALSYRWAHPDARMDRLCDKILATVHQGQEDGASRREMFGRIWGLACDACDAGSAMRAKAQALADAPTSAPIPHLSEPWYC